MSRVSDQQSLISEDGTVTLVMYRYFIPRLHEKAVQYEAVHVNGTEMRLLLPLVTHEIVASGQMHKRDLLTQTEMAPVYDPSGPSIEFDAYANTGAGWATAQFWFENDLLGAVEVAMLANQRVDGIEGVQRWIKGILGPPSTAIASESLGVIFRTKRICEWHQSWGKVILLLAGPDKDVVVRFEWTK